MTFRLGVLVLGLAGCLTVSAIAADDVEVLGRGPVHDAFAEPSEREPVATPVIPKEPPKAIEELPPDQKPVGDNVQWISGYWAWDMDKKDFIWVSGFWRNVPPGRSWMAGSWRKAADGWQWTGGFWASAKAGKAEIEYLPQPPAPLDTAGPTTPAPNERHIYTPGSWVWRDRYVWRPGFWYEHRPDWVWSGAHYRWTPAGYIFIDGYWDYPLANRGILFAPAYIPPVIYSAPDYVYTPSYVVRDECLFGAFFNRRGYGGYYYGDYFAPHYASFGFSAWIGHGGLSLSIGGGGWYDPLFSYYRCGFRNDPFWGGGIFDLYGGRYRGDYLRPPINLVQQNTVINNITNINNINNVNTNNVNMLTSLNKSGRKLEGVHETSRKEHQQIAKVFREAGNQRATTETQLATRPGAGGKTGAPTVATLDAPQRPTLKPVGGKGTDPIVGVGPKPVLTGPIAPPPPTPVSPGRPVAKGAGSVVPKANLGAGITVPKGTIDPTIVPKGGTLPLPKGGTTGPIVNPKLPSVPLPKGGTVDPKPMLTPKVDVPRPKSIVIPPAGPPPGVPALKPPTSSPPVSVPKPPPSLPVAPKSFAPPAPVAPRIAAPAPVAPRIAAPAPVAPRIAAPPPRPAPAPAKPAASKPAPKPAKKK